MSIKKVFCDSWEDYELIDAGGGKKLERFGSQVLIRPDVNAYFKSVRSFKEWRNQAHFEFIETKGQSGKWKKLKESGKDSWLIRYDALRFNLELTKFKHVGIFPEQRINWDFIKNNINSDSRFLNLFAYTGAASCVARYNGAETLHVDSVKQLISWAKWNMESSKLLNIKWVHEDALKFSEREVRRGKSYNGIIMDPPAWGIGAKNEKWKLEDKLDLLLGNAARLLAKDGFLILNTYSPKVNVSLLSELAELYFPEKTYEVVELWMKTETGKELYYGNILRVN